MDPLVGQHELLAGTRNLLAGFYAAVALLNVVGAVVALRSQRRAASVAAAVFAALVCVLAYMAWSGNPDRVGYIALPAALRDFVDAYLAGPEALIGGSRRWS